MNMQLRSCSIARIAAVVLAFSAFAGAAPAHAQTASATPAPAAIPAAYTLSGITHIYQGWNNCGPATLTMSLSYFGSDRTDQYAAAAWLKPNSEDKNVSPGELIEYVNGVVDGTTRALLRQGGNTTLLRTLIANNFPVMVEAGYDPPNDDQGWMGHYLLVSGYDDATMTFTTQDSFEGPNYPYTYDYLDGFWRHFNRLYIVYYPIQREAELMTLLGSDADEAANYDNALATARQEAISNPDAFAWFNMGTNFVYKQMYTEAATAYDQARNLGLPWRMNWYQFGAFRAYVETGRFGDVIALAQANLNDGGGQYVEETFYYAALARYGMGETDRALNNLDGALAFNPNFAAAREARDQMRGT